MRLQKRLLDLVLPKKSGGIGSMNFRMLRLIIHKSYLYKNLSSSWFFGGCVLRIWSWRCLQSQTEPKKHVQTMEWVKTLVLFRSHQNTWKIWCKHITYIHKHLYIYIYCTYRISQCISAFDPMPHRWTSPAFYYRPCNKMDTHINGQSMEMIKLVKL